MIVLFTSVFEIGLDFCLCVPTLPGVWETLAYHQLAPGAPLFRSGHPWDRRDTSPQGAEAPEYAAVMFALTATGVSYCVL